MSLIQRVMLAILPKSWGDDMRKESQSWQIRCETCGHAKSIWDVGGIRWKASSKGKWTMCRCPHCGGLRKAAIERATHN